MGEKMKYTCMHLSNWTGDEEQMLANGFGLQAKVDGILEDRCEPICFLQIQLLSNKKELTFWQ